MAVNRKTLKNNIDLVRSVSELKDLFPGTRALVLKDVLPGLEAIAVKDFYNLVILETDAALISVPVPDFSVYADESPYRNNVLFLDSLASNASTIFITNFNAIETFTKLNRQTGLSNQQFLPATAGTSSTDPAIVRKTPSGLDSSEPGVHLARIMGCTDIQYTGDSDNATKATLASITAFTEQPGRFFPVNQIQQNRSPVLEVFF